ncbi:YceI family protein [Burkholderia pseudomultivorans]|uniref:Protein YceI n=1 Tax=Burkholderia pseudomultivorans TaxID=1207504 RepID=A0ABU2DX99_9BURK|nr:YceI family protein [Burkholderia pseudomultivorans]MDR8726365.1 Protein YceI [Burkholderia pseudomultivorans]MDR8733589.1 Protein YceI [Burkholderia pseudomultivorans]MDR8740115.1 Protein YceI [Burkholderia pseudomultivorans]MDR8752217.1 Protein YceI [Burkholderia pseudomultivorans]MDR8776612.1 Protein YceI [Burkholderia pseudomultivorans]
MKRRNMVIAMLAALGWAAATPSQARVDIARSSVVATITQMNVPVDGKFGKFVADVSFGPDHPEKGSATVVVDTASYDLGDEGFNHEARGSAWFDATAYPKATFRSTGIRSAGVGTFEVTGQLTIKGMSKSVVVPVKYAKQGMTDTYDGVLAIKRSDFKVGTGEWVDTSVVGDSIKVKFHIVNVK